MVSRNEQQNEQNLSKMVEVERRSLRSLLEQTYEVGVDGEVLSVPDQQVSYQRQRAFVAKEQDFRNRLDQFLADGSKNYQEFCDFFYDWVPRQYLATSRTRFQELEGLVHTQARVYYDLLSRAYPSKAALSNSERGVLLRSKQNEAKIREECHKHLTEKRTSNFHPPVDPEYCA